MTILYDPIYRWTITKPEEKEKEPERFHRW